MKNPNEAWGKSDYAPSHKLNDIMTQATFIGNIKEKDGCIQIHGNVPPAFLKTIEERRKTKATTASDPVSSPQDLLEKDQKSRDWAAKKHMGLSPDHPFGSPSSVIPRAFRFLVEVENFPKLGYLIKDVEIDHVHKQLKMSIYETKDLDAEEIINKLSWGPKPLVIWSLDGCGHKLFAYEFTGLQLHTLSTRLDYSDSDVWTHKAVLSFKQKVSVKAPQQTPVTPA